MTDRIRNDLNVYFELLSTWQRSHNLISPASEAAIWERHVADSLQLVEHAPAFGEWLDLGSGAGFPGLVVAIAFKGKDAHFTLVESNQKKAAFLRAAIRETGANASVAAERAETYAGRMRERADVVSARALAPLVVLCGLALPYLKQNGALLLLKGRDFVREIEEASKSWSFDVLDYPSVTDSSGRVLLLRRLAAKGA